MPLIVATVAAGQNLLSCDYLTRCGLLRFAVGAFLVVSALGAVFAALVYIMAAPLAQPDMVDFYRMYRPGALIFLLGLFIIQFVFGVAAVYRGK